MEILHTSLPGCLELRPQILEDARGRFVKTFHHDVFSESGLNTVWNEEYYSSSYRNVIRGFHFQNPPCDHVKLVYCLSGTVVDVLLDIRRGSPTYGQVASFELGAAKGNMLYIPSGIAHGFSAISEEAIMQYKVSTVYAPQHDSGIRWDSVGFRWPTDAPVISKRDREFVTLESFVTPFTFHHE
jgi:dTDP-4-dehydrorhamnose 3,5-epimerase